MNKPSINVKPIPDAKTNISSIANLRIYQLACSLEAKLHDLAKELPVEQFYPLGNDLRRSGAAVAHYISETHKRYSYIVKIESLHAARTAAEDAIRHLETYRSTTQKDLSNLIEDYNSLIRQSWGLIRYLKSKQDVAASQQQASAIDELVQARA